MAPKIPIGISDFRQLRESGCYYVDKTDLIREIVDLSTATVLLPRPRRFGKTLNLSMLWAYFEKSGEDLSPIFDGLRIFSAGPEYRAHFQKYPVIHLSFKDVKATRYADCYGAIKRRIMDECERHRAALLADGVLSPEEADRFKALMRGEAEEVDYWAALEVLSRYLHHACRRRVIILIDEYDVPIQAGFSFGYYDEVTTFFRNFFGGGFKDNSSLHKGVLTGVLRIARESIFSGLNNISVYSVLDPEFAAAFGFTEAEVARLMEELSHPEQLGEVQRWYNGYRFGGEVIYNPWSVLNFAQRPAQGTLPYWVFTSSDDVLRQLVLERGYPVLDEFAALLEGKTIDKPVSEHVVLRDIEGNAHAMWSLLLFSGYLTAEKTWLEEGSRIARLRIPNEELRYVFRQSVLSWISRGPTGADRLDQLLSAMLRGDTEQFAARLAELPMVVLSAHDTAGRQPERVYHGFVLGLLVRLLPRYEVSSNQEAFLGRYDVALLPRSGNQPGVVLEFKVAKGDSNETVNAAITEALDQIEKRGYAGALVERGAKPIFCYGVACRGKRVFVRRSDEEAVYGFEGTVLTS